MSDDEDDKLKISKEDKEDLGVLIRALKIQQLEKEMIHDILTINMINNIIKLKDEINFTEKRKSELIKFRVDRTVAEIKRLKGNDGLIILDPIPEGEAFIPLVINPKYSSDSDDE